MSSWEQRSSARDTLSRESGFVRKPHGGRLRVALAFPNTYYVGMSSLGFQAVYRLFNDLDDVVCERVFLPPRPRRAHPRSSPAPLVTLESQTPVCDFDVVAFSASFEWDDPNVLAMLRLAGLPIRARARDTRHPLVVVGGAVAQLNPEPLAPFVDVFAVGDGEVLVPAFSAAVAASGSRPDLLERLARIGGFYVPSLVEPAVADNGRIAGFAPRAGAGFDLPVRRAILPASQAVEPPSTTIFTPDTEFGSRLLIEVVRGCPNLCRFCWAGYNCLPVRSFDAGAILRRAAEARPLAASAGLVSIALCRHPEIHRILAGLRAMGYRISPASLRLDDLTESLVHEIVTSGERTFTLAPETGSDRLRRVANKGFTNQQILDAADLVFRNGAENLKLYFMIGLPSEEDDDLVAIRDLAREVRDRMLDRARVKGRAGRIAASVNPFVPKPGTAWQWLPMTRPDQLERKARRLRALVANLDNVSFTIKSERHFLYQALLSVGDRRVSAVLEAADRNGGNWRAAVAEAGIDLDEYLFRDRRHDTVLPWDVVAPGVPVRFLRSELERSASEPGP